MQRKKKAFTLTELLVVVVIIGVLSAVVLPKFSKVLETRKTTEAEEMMAAVRNEQEARCTLSKNYTDITKLSAYRAGKNFSYANNSEGVGIIATAKNNKYNLEIPSYADGRVCCSDIEPGACASLNKNYPLCDDLINNTSDYVVGNADCGIPGVGENPQPEPEPGCVPPAQTTETNVLECGCTNSGKKTGTRTFDSESCSWGNWEWTECSEAETDCREYCAPGKPGWDKWVDIAQNCEQPQDPAAQPGSWNTNTCKCDCPTGTELSPDGEGCISYCAPGKPGWFEKWVDIAQNCEQPQDPAAQPGSWNTNTCECDCPTGTEPSPDGDGCIAQCSKTTENLVKAQTCEDPQVVPGYAPVPGVWNWDGPHACSCDCPPGTKLDGYGQCVPGCQKTDENLWDAQDCETGGRCGKAQGTWNWDGPHACDCDCPSGYHFVKNEGCVPICEQIYGSWINTFKENCLRGDEHEGVYWDYIGTWNDCDCSCICPRGSILYPNGICYDPYYEGRPDDHDYDCPMPQEDCDGWDQWQWDNYDDYVDTLDWDYDWDYYDDGGDWEGW